MKWDWLRSDLLVLSLIILGAILLVVVSPPVHAAPSNDGVVFCEKTATTGDIDYYYCEPNIGPSFVANSVGFLQLEQ